MDKILHNPVFKKGHNRYLYRDSEILSFLDKSRYLHRYNPALFNQMVKHIDNFLHLGKDLDSSQLPENFNLDFENMLTERTKIMNAYHSFVYALPHSPAMVTSYQTGMTRLGELLDTNIRYARRATIQGRSEEHTS